jgi:hypothetical protein
MPLLITPYTFGAELPAAPGGTAGGAYSVRRRRMMTVFAFCLVLILL